LEKTNAADLNESLANGEVKIKVAAPEPNTKILKVGKGETLLGVLTSANLDKQEAQSVVSALKRIYNPRDLKSDQEVTLHYVPVDKGASGPRSVDKLSLRASIEHDIVVSRDDKGKFKAQDIERPLTTTVRYTQGTITSTLSAAGKKSGVPQSVLSEMIRALSYDVDFQREVHPGDKFEVAYEAVMDQDGSIAKTNGIVYVGLKYGKNESQIYRYKPTDDKRADYFDENGKAVRKALLRTPVDGARITSTFGMRRHPLLGYSKMHEGVDFGAPIGTPILAAGDGVVTQKGWNGGYGHYVEIRHNNEYATGYAHMSRYQKTLRVGARVHQGDVIGYVGSTGLSTGAHLHYEVHRFAKKINPMGVKFMTGRQLASKELQHFKVAKLETDKKVAHAREERGGKKFANK
jgi:murein DD-endopeptidase MepM/ murein hydrolase activator NlpD